MAESKNKQKNLVSISSHKKSFILNISTGSSGVTRAVLTGDRGACRSESDQEYLLILGILKQRKTTRIFLDTSCRNPEMIVWDGITSDSEENYRRLIDEYDRNGSQE